MLFFHNVNNDTKHNSKRRYRTNNGSVTNQVKMVSWQVKLNPWLKKKTFHPLNALLAISQQQKHKRTLASMSLSLADRSEWGRQDIGLLGFFIVNKTVIVV